MVTSASALRVATSLPPVRAAYDSQAPMSGTPVASTTTSTGRSTSTRASDTPTGRPSATAWASWPGSSPSTTPSTPARPIRTGRPSSCSRACRRAERLMCITLLRDGLVGLPFDHQRASRPRFGQRQLLQADVAGQRRLGLAVRLQVHVAEVDHVVVGHLADRGDAERRVVDAD